MIKKIEITAYFNILIIEWEVNRRLIMKSEKRNHPRFEIKQLVEVDLGHEKFISAEGINLSRSGVLCRTEEECPLYSKVFMMMTIPHKVKERIISLEGVVIRSVHKKEEWETGISITSMEKASRTLFDEVLNHFSS